MKLKDKSTEGRERAMERRILLIEPAVQHWQLETLEIKSLKKDPREEYLVLSGEPLCQYLLRRDPDTLIIARGPTPFLTGNKTTVGYISPLTGLPHYSYIGGRVAVQLFNLGLDAIAFQSPHSSFSKLPIIIVSGCAPSPTLEFKEPDGLPTGQRSAFYWLVDKELKGDAQSGSVLTLGDGAPLGYRSANLAAEGFYHAGRGGAGSVFAHFASAIILRGEPIEPFEFFGEDSTDFARNPNREITPLIDQYCNRLSSRTGGTIIKLYKTGAHPAGKNTLPAWNAQTLGYAMANAGDEHILSATREGQTGCQWCQVHCRHYHSLPVDYAHESTDLFLDDFEPAYAINAMLGLVPTEDTFEARLDLIADVDKRLMLPIEQMGLDIIDVGVGLSALFEGAERGIIPTDDLPDCLSNGTSFSDPSTSSFRNSKQRLEAAVQAVAILRSTEAARFPALRAVGDGPQALVDRYPEMQDIVFTCGTQTLGNPGHCNVLWTFMMPFSRFFSHYSGQTYKIDGALPPPGSDRETLRTFSGQIVENMLQREFFWLLCNAFSHCAFTFIIFSQDGKGNALRKDDLLVRLLSRYGIHLTNTDLLRFSQRFWAQSIDFKCQLGWRPPSAADFPRRIYEALSIVLDRTPDELQGLMSLLINEWKHQASDVLNRFGYKTSW